MKRIIITVLSMLLLIPSVGICDNMENTIIIPIELFERIVAFNNDEGNWKEYGYEICSAYLPGLIKEECKISESFLSIKETDLGNVKGRLSINLPYAKGEVNLPYEIYARVTDPKATSSDGSELFQNTIKYYTSLLGQGQYIEEENQTYQISNKERDVQIRIIYTDDDTIDMISVYVLQLSQIDNYFGIM